ncbi:hypothetical protein FH972_006091 [Carpinus fangiana]|uniref:Uncharacterized protein n=1 Tax=Carpinus fangiana TaxID=176857 RepID=A0A5N6QR81_9ROSI|nr:hypothetical protein FH972_006091 [Carpinus fangiana]
MANLVRRLKQWPTLHHQVQGCACTTPHHFLSSLFLPLTMTKAVFPHLSLALTAVPLAHRNVHNRTRGLRMPNAPIPSDFQQRGGGSGGSDSDELKNRNQLKREARRAVRWAMELASFSTPQIKRILIPQVRNWTLGIKQKGIMSQQQTNKQLQNLRVVRGGENDKIGKRGKRGNKPCRRFGEYMVSGGELPYQQLCSEIAVEFNDCSKQVLEMESLFLSPDYPDYSRVDLAQLLRAVQAQEKQKLHLTVTI